MSQTFEDLLYHYADNIPLMITMQMVLVELDSNDDSPITPRKILAGKQKYLEFRICNEGCVKQSDTNDLGFAIYDWESKDEKIVITDSKDFYEQICTTVGDKVVREIKLTVIKGEVSFYLNFCLTSKSKYSTPPENFLSDIGVLSEMWKRWFRLALGGLDFYRCASDI